jgi:hypothetical protein
MPGRFDRAKLPTPDPAGKDRQIIAATAAGCRGWCPKAADLRRTLRLDAGPPLARARDRIAIAACRGGSDLFDQAVTGIAAAYADQNERGYRRWWTSSPQDGSPPDPTCENPATGLTGGLSGRVFPLLP